MAVRIQIPKKAALVRFVLHPWGRAFLIVFFLFNTLALLAFTFYYARYAKLIEQKLVRGPLANTSMLFAAPQPVMVGDELTIQEIALALRRSGYAGSKGTSRMGWYNMRADGIEIFPGPESYFDDDEAVIKFKGHKVSQIISLRDNAERTQYLIEPELITNLFDRSREKRRIVTFRGPAADPGERRRLGRRQALLPALRLRSASHPEGGLRRYQGRPPRAGRIDAEHAACAHVLADAGKDLERKLAETMITLHLEQKLSKEKIFEYYSNQVDLGRRGQFRHSWIRRGGAGLFRQRRSRSDPAGGRDARRA